jgi:predicted nucleotidyltransferase
MLKNLFASKIRINILAQFLMNPDREFYLREFVKILNISPRSVSLELKNLSDIDFLKKRISGHQHYYIANTSHILFKDLQNIFLKTVGVKDVIYKVIKLYEKNIEYCFIYGSIAEGNFSSDSDIDLMIIGDINSKMISKVVLKAGETLNREINFSIFTKKELLQRLNKNDHFISHLYLQPKIFVIGESNEFERMGKKRMAKKTLNKSRGNTKYITYYRT